MHANKSSAPTTLTNSNSCRQTSTSRSSEINNPMRKSFGANPFMKPSIVTNPRGLNPITPANSPSDYHQRAALTRESLTSLRDFEDKENGKDQHLKQSRLKSPSVVKGGTKNFMSPTISAASKVNASPRKKILAERNDPTRISGNDFPETFDMNLKPECELGQAKIEASSDSTVTSVKDSSGPVNEATSASKGSKKKVAFDTKVETIPPLKESECVDVNEDVKAVASPISKSPCAASTLLAPLDADPLMPPYDPKTNFLSPRPQFLHYKPSPRINRYLDEEGDENPLEESFNLDGFSDTEVTDETQSDSSQKESSDDAAHEKLAKDVETTGEVPVSEVVPSVAEVEKGTVELRNPSKQCFFTKTKCSALILLMVLAGLWMWGSNPALRNISASNDPTSFSKLFEEYETLEVVRENLEGLAQNLWHWYDSSCSYISELAHKLSGGTTFGPVLYYNLTDTQEGLWPDNSIVEEISWKTSVMMADYKEKLDEKPLHELDGYEADFEVMEDGGAEDGLVVEEGQDGTSDDVPDEVNNPKNEAEEGDVIAVEGEISLVADPEVLLEQVLPHEEVASVPAETEVRSTVVETPKVAEPELFPEQEPTHEVASVPMEMEGGLTTVGTPKVAEPELFPEQEPTHEVASVPMEMEGGLTTVGTPKVAEPELFPEQEPTHEVTSVPIEMEGGFTTVATVDVAATRPATEYSVPLMVGVFSLIVAALVASALSYMKKGRSFLKSSPAVVDQSNLAKKFNISPQHDERWSSYPTEVDVVGESCPSEMSSFQNNSPRGKGLYENEAHSYERKQTKKTRRESMASSDLSLGSASYGSFTTYEMISAKHRNGEEEVVVTPIRRSSRLRKQVISP